MKILIIEDEKVLSKALNIEILKERYETYSAYDGVSGVEAAKELLPDMIILDLILPEMDGFEVIHKIRTSPATEKIPIIILSNLGQDKDVKKAMALGANGYFIKTSVDLSEITDNIKKLLKK